MENQNNTSLRTLLNGDKMPDTFALEDLKKETKHENKIQKMRLQSDDSGA